jgi:hypothetical protein
LADRYFFQQTVITFLAVVILAGSAVVARAALGTSWIPFAAVGLVLGAHQALTVARMARGWFGNNPMEARELISFLVSQRRDKGLPPGTRAFGRTTSAPAQRDVSLGGLVGAKP